MGNFLTTDGLSTLLSLLNSKFSRKKHKHASDDIEGLSTVARTGNYNDLTNRPSAQQNVSIATASKAGIVKPGDGMSVDGSGTMSVNLDTTSGLSFVSNKISLNLGNSFISYKDKYYSCMEVRENGWREVYGELKNLANLCYSKGKYGMGVSVKNSAKGTASSMFIVLTLENITALRGDTILRFITTSVGDTSSLAVSDCCDSAEVAYYEALRLMSIDCTVDAVGLFLFGKVIGGSLPMQNMVANIGRVATDVVSVVEYNKNRFRTLRIDATNSTYSNTGVTYVFFEGKYVPLFNMLTKFNNHVENSK